MPLKEPDSPLLFHYFCYYLKWVYENEMFTIGDTLNCSYGGLRPWDSPGKNTGVGYHFLLQGIFPTQGWNLGLLHCRQML